MNLKKQTYFYALLIFILLFLILAYGLIGIKYGCTNAIDFSIYQEAIYRFANGEGINPYLTVRNIKILNDHFDPVYMLAAPFALLTNYSAYSLIVFEFLWLIGLILLILFKTQFKLREKLILILMVLLTKGILTAFLFPIHTTTWSIVPIFLIFYFLHKKNDLGIIISSISLMLFREAFPFAIFGLSLYFLYKKQMKLFSTLLISSLIFIIFVFIIRPQFIGSTSNYASHVMHLWFPNPFKTITEVSWSIPLKVFAPFVIPYYFLYKKSSLKELLNSKALAYILFFMPLFLIHALTWKFSFQYGSFLTTPLLCGLIFHPKISMFLCNKRAISLTIIIFILTGMGRYTKVFNRVVLSKDNKCVISLEKEKNTKEVNQLIKNLPPQKNILSTGGIIPRMLNPRQNFYHLDGFSLRIQGYDLLILEKEFTGDSYPTSQETLKYLQLSCKRSEIINNQFYFVAEVQNNKFCSAAIAKLK